jgi:hypothetical protein
VSELEKAQADRRVRLPPVARAKTIALFVSATVVLCAGAFVVGLFVKAPSAVLDETADSSVPVFAEAEMRPVDDGLVIQAMTERGETLTVSGTGVSEFPGSVVTAINIAPGETLSNGVVLGAISNRPLIALQLHLPLYRDLATGDQGPDVSSLQAALGVADTGRFDSTTRDAVAQLYANAGYAPPGGTRWAAYVRMAEIVPMTAVEHRVLTVATVGASVSDAPFLTAEVGAVRVVFRANAAEVEQLTVGQEVSVTAAGVSVAGVVSSIGSFTEAAADGSGSATRPGYDVIVTLQSTEGLRPGVSAIVSTSTDEPDQALAVPAAALRSEDGQPYVLVRVGSDVEKVDVRVVTQSSGWVAVETEEFEAGDEVRVWP